MLKKSLLIQCALMTLFAMLVLATVPATAAHHEAAEGAKNIYICGCGPQANCSMAADQPGSAPCGKPLLEKQVLKEDETSVYVCACPEGCQCGLSESDPAKCACGKELRAYPKDADKRRPHAMMPAGCGKVCDDCPNKAGCSGCPKAQAEAK